MLVLVPGPLGWAKAQLFYTELFVKTAGKQTSWSRGLMITELLSEAGISNRSHIAKSQLVSANRGFFFFFSCNYSYALSYSNLLLSLCNQDTRGFLPESMLPELIASLTS